MNFLIIEQMAAGVSDMFVALDIGKESIRTHNSSWISLKWFKIINCLVYGV